MVTLPFHKNATLPIKGVVVTLLISLPNTLDTVTLIVYSVPATRPST